MDQHRHSSVRATLDHGHGRRGVAEGLPDDGGGDQCRVLLVGGLPDRLSVTPRLRSFRAHGLGAPPADAGAVWQRASSYASPEVADRD